MIRKKWILVAAPLAMIIFIALGGQVILHLWNWLLPDRFAALRASTESRGHRWYALLAPFEQEEVRRNLPGDWREIDRVGDVALWELPPAAGR